jgi:hypothetical protein
MKMYSNMLVAVEIIIFADHVKIKFYANWTCLAGIAPV